MYELHLRLTEYLTFAISTEMLESWLVSHLQEILDSGDAEAIGIANKVDAALIQLREAILTKQELRKLISDLVVS